MLHHTLAVFLQHQADKGFCEIRRRLTGCCEQQGLLLILREHRIVNRRAQLRHLDVTLGELLHLCVDSILDLCVHSTLE